MRQAEGGQTIERLRLGSTVNRRDKPAIASDSAFRANAAKNAARLIGQSRFQLRRDAEYVRVRRSASHPSRPIFEHGRIALGNSLRRRIGLILPGVKAAEAAVCGQIALRRTVDHDLVLEAALELP